MKKLTTYFQPSARQYFSEIDPRVIESARLTADGGSYRLASEIAEQILVDSRVRAALYQRVDGVIGLRKIFKHSNPKVLEAIDADWSLIFPHGEHALWLKRSLIAGIGLVQIKLVSDPSTGRLIPAVESWRTHGLSFLLRERLYEIEIDRGGGAYERIRLDLESGQWIITTPYSSERPCYHGLWNTLAEVLAGKKYSWKDWQAYSENHGRAFRILQQLTLGDAGLYAGRDIADLVSEVGEATAGSTIGLPPGIEAKLLESTSTTWQTFPKQLETANTEIAIAICGQNLTTEVKSGALASAQVHQNVVRQLIVDTAKLDETETLPVLRLWEKLNFGTQELVFYYDTEDPNDRLVRASTLKSLGDGLQSVQSVEGLEVDVSAVVKGYEVPLIESTSTAELSASAHADTTKAIAGQKLIDSMRSTDLQTAFEPMVDRISKIIADAQSLSDIEREIGLLKPDGAASAVEIEKALRMAVSIGAFSAVSDGE